MAEITSANSTAAIRQAQLRQIRDALAQALVFVHSRHYTGLSMTRSVDEVRDIALEQIEGPTDPKNPLIVHTRRQLSEKERVERTRQRLLMVIDTLEADPTLMDV